MCRIHPAPPVTPRPSRTIKSFSRSTARSTPWPTSPRWRRNPRPPVASWPGLNADRFQAGLARCIGSKLYSRRPASTISSLCRRPNRPTRSHRRPLSFVQLMSSTYSTKQLATGAANLGLPLAGPVRTASFTIAVKKGGTTTHWPRSTCRKCRAGRRWAMLSLTSTSTVFRRLLHSFPEDREGRHHHQ